MYCRRLSLAPIFFFILILCSPVATYGGTPMEGVRDTTNKIIAIVSDPALKTPDKKKEKAGLIRAAVDERFNWEEMSKRALARHWSARTEEEKKEFIDLFGKLLERTYLDKVEGYSGEKVLYVDEVVDEKYATVSVKIVTKKDTEISVLYRVKKDGDNWLVYDISIEGVSLINNYRKQFNSIIVQNSYKELVDKLREKVEK
ncbi:MAG TPA: ABC transporter substrate-binding protein [Deltaproteobacteria bacterium]|nr:ABC transporter substrate-binding protein [Deltaproteobacteria bacterium]